MRPNSSPPQQAEHIRHQSLTPESPRPQNVPSPANIPILVEHMDANYSHVSHSNDSAAPAHSSHANANTSTPYFADPSSTASFQSIGAQGAGHDAPGAFAQSAAFGGGMGTQPHDTSSMQNFTAQLQSRAASATDAPPPAAQGLSSAYPYPHDHAYAAQQAPAQSAQGAHYQTDAHTGSNVDVQALLDSLTPAANNAPAAQYASAQMSSQSPQTQHHASSLPSATNLPARPPTQEQPATHPNYNPSDDIRSYHPQSQQAPIAQQRGNGSLQPLNVQSQDFSTPSQAQQQPGDRSETPDDEDQRWPPEVNRRYEEFLDQERKFVTEGQWDQFPMGSRLFIGNLPTEKVTKRDIFHRFYRHGRLAQISIKQAYGFVQFLDSESCRRALDAEQGQAVRGRKMHLEISKPQRNTKKIEPPNPTPRRRSRSPDYNRGGTGPAPRDNRYILVLNEGLPRDFIRYVEDTFRSQNLRSNVLILSGRFPEPAVVRRQILEGVLAIVRLDTTGLTKGKVSVQIFDRRGGANNVQFNEYADLDPTTAGLLVNNAKQSQSRPVLPPSSSYGFAQTLPPHFPQPNNPFPSLPTSQPNISNLIASLDGASLSQLLGAMSGNNMPQNTQPAPNQGLNADLARLLAQVPSPAQTPGFSAQSQPHLAQLGNQFPALASLFANQSQAVAPPVQTPTQAGPAPDMNEIMAQLAQYQR
ncbi:uncharacterized protein J4E87_005612 [Alternaria ethzedia]|uniref:uncharacterized protein n=1 Tax=Alternaria ethzedia TaxID=181014 RepID=UPI0020C41A3A|nr:uncharacterized protein J4E87_005612 [Alternaria ethzedia]KAI4624114.1 hypothetical protein J4E87_005612 [Alternaria ethzedia]KAI4705341.1 hypothetical protein J4E81_000223 [Alternaria sp. BMP 2799]